MNAPLEILAAEAQIIRQRHARESRIAFVLTTVFCVPASAVIGAGLTALASYWRW